MITYGKILSLIFIFFLSFQDIHCKKKLIHIQNSSRYPMYVISSLKDKQNSIQQNSIQVSEKIEVPNNINFITIFVMIDDDKKVEQQPHVRIYLASYKIPNEAYLYIENGRNSSAQANNKITLYIHAPRSTPLLRNTFEVSTL